MKLLTVAFLLLGISGTGQKIQDYFPLEHGRHFMADFKFGERTGTDHLFVQYHNINEMEIYCLVPNKDKYDEVASIHNNGFNPGAYFYTKEGLFAAEVRWKEDLQDLKASDFSLLIPKKPEIGKVGVLTYGDRGNKYEMFYLGIEATITPYGEYEKCMHFRCLHYFGSKVEETEFWLAKDKGIVKKIYPTSRIEYLVDED